ncbi:MAG TPA: MmgE/PrpD family protein [Beijerinckiaceae bacterium]
MSAVDFIHGLRFEDLPAAVVAQAKRCVLDLLGVAASGLETDLSRIVRDHAVRHMGAGEGRGARLLFDGRRASVPGAAYAGASTIDAFDAHDGHPLTKGHAGVAVLPAVLALFDSEDLDDGREFLAALVVGYEVAIRAGIALHGSVPDYHTSGAWNALGCAAVGARLLGLSPDATRQALGIAEYHGPRSQMMRCIDHPTMLKDGSGWGAFAGLSAAYLAQDGFTGAPAITVEAPEQAHLWSDLGRRWRILEIYFKPLPVCRWAQPAIEAALSLARAGRIDPDRIEAVEVETFDAAVRLGARAAATTEEAQYALGFPLAAALATGRLTAGEIAGAGLRDARTLRLLPRIRLVEREEFTRRFPAERIAAVAIRLDDGTTLTSGPMAARGDADSPLDDEELRAKFRSLAGALPRDDCAALIRAVEELGDCDTLDTSFLPQVLKPLLACEPARPPCIAATLG